MKQSRSVIYIYLERERESELKQIRRHENKERNIDDSTIRHTPFSENLFKPPKVIDEISRKYKIGLLYFF